MPGFELRLGLNVLLVTYSQPNWWLRYFILPQCSGRTWHTYWTPHSYTTCRSGCASDSETVSHEFEATTGSRCLVHEHETLPKLFNTSWILERIRALFEQKYMEDLIVWWCVCKKKFPCYTYICVGTLQHLWTGVNQLYQLC